jgi:hypothetical protein
MNVLVLVTPPLEGPVSDRAFALAKRLEHLATGRTSEWPKAIFIRQAQFMELPYIRKSLFKEFSDENAE